MNKPDSALQAYENTIALDSSFSDSHLNAGEILFSFKRYEEAVPYFAYVIKDRPNEYLGYDKLSYLYFSMKEYQKSVLVNKAAIQKLPNLIDPYINIGRTFIAAGQNDSALYYLQIARNMDPANQLIIDLQASVGK
ncbi:MAG: tetratricopeptide repeat protein [Bacteroidetes bacterium]|nr:tetratricopeptide repeat protein [Bacteroidota bacterium]